MFVNSEYIGYIQKNKKTISILIVSGFLLGMVLGKFFFSVKPDSVVIPWDVSKFQSHQSNSQDKSSRIKE